MSIRREGPGLQSLAVALKDLDGVQGKVGWFESAKYTDGTPVAHVAAIQEFGSGAIPPRPFMRTTLAEKQGEWGQQLEAGAGAVLDGKATARQVLEATMLRAAGDVAKKIASIYTPPLSPLTLLARQSAGSNKRLSGAKELGALARELDKGPPNVGGVSTKPLVWTGQMIQSVTGVVEPDGK